MPRVQTIFRFADVGPIDLLQRAVAPAIQRAAPHQPVGRIGFLKHLAGDGHESGGRLLPCDARYDQQKRAQGREEKLVGNPHGYLLITRS